MNIEELFWTLLTILFFCILGIIFFPFIIAVMGLGMIYFCIMLFGFRMHTLMHHLHFCPACGVFPSFLTRKISTH